MFEKFTERAREAVVLAQDEARALGHDYIGTEHLLLGLLREHDGLAARVLWSLDITLEEVRSSVARIVGEGESSTTGQIPFTPRAKRVLELSSREARSLGHDSIGTEHILLGLVREGEGVAARILLDFGADAEQVRSHVIGVLSGAPRTAPTPFEPQTPPFAPEVAAELARLRGEKETQIEHGELEAAGESRDREQRLAAAARGFAAAWSSRDAPARRPARGAGRRDWSERAVAVAVPESRRDWTTTAAAGVWALFGLAVGVLLGWAIWG